MLNNSRRAQAAWANVGLVERQQLLSKTVDAFVARGDDISREITWQMGRLITQKLGEVRGFEERARHMLAIAPVALGDITPDHAEGFNRFIRRISFGVVAILAPWDYPYLTAVNGVIPALMASNTVILKHSHQTPLCAERADFLLVMSAYC